MEITHANIYGDGLTVYEETWADERIVWLNGFSVKTIEDRALGIAYTYPANTLEQLFQDIRNDLIEVEGADGTVYGRVDKFGRDLRGDHPNIILLVFIRIRHSRLLMVFMLSDQSWLVKKTYIVTIKDCV